MINEQRRYPLLKNIIPLLKFSVVVSSAFLMPGTTKIFAKPLQGPSEFDDYEVGYMRRTIKRLERRGLISIVTKGEKTTITLSEKGKLLALTFDLENMKIGQNHNPNGRITGVVFDITEEKKKNRNLFAHKLVEIGFVKFQDSVYFCPFACEKEIEFLRNYFDISKEVTYFVIDKIEDESFLRAMFRS